MGTQSWAEANIEFVTGPETKVVANCAAADPSDKLGNKIRGTAWVDDVALFPLPPARATSMKGLRIGICALLAFSVFAHGVVEPWSEAVLEIGTAVLLLWWGLLFARGRRAACAGIVCFGRLPPSGCGLQCSTALASQRWPFRRRLNSSSFPRWRSCSSSSCRLLRRSNIGARLPGFCWLWIWRLRFGILQHFTFNGKLYWFRELRYGGIPFGPYVNRNHFAGFVELIIPMGLSILLLRADDRDRMSLLAVLTLMPIGAFFFLLRAAGLRLSSWRLAWS